MASSAVVIRRLSSTYAPVVSFDERRRYAEQKRERDAEDQPDQYHPSLLCYRLF